MTGFFDGHERLTELLEEIPQLTKEALGQGQQVHSKVARQLRDLEQKRSRAADLTAQIRGALEGLQGVSQGGADELTARLTTLMESAQRVGDSLPGDVETIESAVDEVEAAATDLRSALTSAGARVTQAAEEVSEGVSGLGENTGAAIAELGEASEASASSAAELLGQTAEEARQRLDAVFQSQVEQMAQVVEAADGTAAGTVQNLEAVSGEQQAKLGELAARLTEKAGSLAEEAIEKLVNGVSSPVDERLQEAKEQILFLGQQMEITEQLSQETQATVEEKMQLLEQLTETGRELSRAVTHVISTIEL